MKNSGILINVFLFGLISLLFISCTKEIPDPQKAQAFIENYMKQINEKNFDKLSNYYSEEMNNGESDEARLAKFKQLDLTIGKMISYKLIDTKSIQDVDAAPRVDFTYEVKHQRLTVMEMYSVIKEGENYKVARQNTVSKRVD